MVYLSFPHVFFKIVMFKHNVFDPTCNHVTHYAFDRYQHVVNHLRFCTIKLSCLMVLPFLDGVIVLMLFLARGSTLMLVCVELDSKLISASSEPTTPACIESEEMMVGACGGGALLLDVIKLGLNTISPPFVALLLPNNAFTLKFADRFNGAIKLTNNFVCTPKNFVMHTMHPKEILRQNTNSKHCTMHKQFI